MTTSRLPLRLKNQSGIIAFDYLIAFTIIFCLVLLFMSLSFAISFTEVVQYMAFASARSYMAGHFTEEAQVATGQAKFQTMRLSQGFRGFDRTQMIVLPAQVDFGNPQSGFNNEYESLKVSFWRNSFFGARIPIRFRVLEKNIPLLGAIAETDEGFTATLQAFLIREPSVKECELIMQQRYLRIISSDAGTPFPNRYQDVSASPGATTGDLYYRNLDNGC